MQDNSLYLLDDITDASGRYLRVLRITTDGVMSERARISYTGTKTQIYLTATYDGMLLLSASGPAYTDEPFHIVIDPSFSEAKAVARLSESGQGQLVMAPDARDPAIYSIAKTTNGTDAILGEVQRGTFEVLAPTSIQSALPEPL